MSDTEKPSLVMRAVAWPIGMAVAAGMIAIDGLAITKLWLWFIVPLGTAAIPFWNACGLSVFAGLMASNAGAGHRETVEDGWSEDRKLLSAWRGLKWSVTIAIMALAFGWAIQAWVKP